MVPELARIGSWRAVGVFVSLSTGSADNELRLPAIDALGLLGAREAVKTLEDLAKRDVHGPVRKKAIESLARIGKQRRRGVSTLSAVKRTGPFRFGGQATQFP